MGDIAGDAGHGQYFTWLELCFFWELSALLVYLPEMTTGLLIILWYH